MTSVSKSEREKQNLSLASPPGLAGVEVENPLALHSASLSAKARKSPRSHGSGESFISSGCHWTAIAHQSAPSHSIASTIPSGAVALTLNPGATSLTL